MAGEPQPPVASAVSGTTSASSTTRSGVSAAKSTPLRRARDQMLELTAGWHRAEIEQLVEETLEEVADPLVYAEALTLIEEHKREGRKAFKSMWERVGQQVTSAIFRLEKESPAFVGSLWEITSTTHEDAGSVAQYEESSGGLEPGQKPTAVEPIRNAAPKVGRNDPCPCGSGKKYKKCHGAA